MTVGELIAHLQEYCKPEDEVLVISSFYNGSTEEYELHHPALVIGYGDVIISPDETYHKREAQNWGHLFCTVHSDSTVT